MVAVVAICVAGFLYFTKLELTPGTKQTAAVEKAARSSTAASPSPSPTQSAQVASTARPVTKPRKWKILARERAFYRRPRAPKPRQRICVGRRLQGVCDR